MRLTTVLLVIAGLCTTAGPACAAEAGGYRVAITPVFGYRMGGDFDRDDAAEGEDAGDGVELDDDAMYGLVINLPAESLDGDAYTEWEVYLARQSVGLDDAPATVDPALELDITHILLGGTYVGAGNRMRPFLSAGIGAAHLSPDDSGYDSDTVFAFGIGGGAQVFPDRRLGLRFEGRLLGSVIDSDNALFCKSGAEGASCAFRASSDVLWQWEVYAGVTYRL